jgi:hypothetical protein
MWECRSGGRRQSGNKELDWRMDLMLALEWIKEGELVL